MNSTSDIINVRASADVKSVPKTKKSNLDRVIKDFNSSWQYTESSWHSRWERNYKLYHNTRVEKSYEGITNTFVPMTFSTIETMVAALFGGKPRFNFTPPKETPDQNTEILNSVLDYYWDKDKWNIKVINWGRGMLMLGTSVVYLYWQGDHPCMVNVPIRDFFIDPTASSIENARYVGRRYLCSLEDLKTYEVVDPATGEMKPKYKNLDKVVKKRGGDGSNTDKEEKDMFYGSTVEDAENEQVEIIEYWTDDEVVTIANRSTVIEESENYFKARARANGEQFPKGLKPFACLRDYVDESLFYATGEVDYMKDQQELLNDITNQNIDSVTYTLNQMFTLDPKYSHLLDQIENLPGAVYPVEANALQPIQQRPVPGDAFNERLNLKNEIRETTASNEIVKGVGNDSSATATEINAQIAGAGQRLALKITQIENEGFHQLATIVLQMIKLYINEPFMVRVVGKSGVSYEEFDPTMFTGDYEPRVQLESTINSQKQQLSSSAKEMLAAFLGDPYVNQQELRRLALTRGFDLDPDEVELLIQDPATMGMGGVEGLPPEAPIEPMMGGELGMGVVPSEMPMEPVL